MTEIFCSIGETGSLQTGSIGGKGEVALIKTVIGGVNLTGTLTHPAQGGFIAAVTFNEDGSVIYGTDVGSGDIYSSDLSEPYDITSNVTNEVSVSGGGTSLVWGDNGSRLYVPSTNNFSDSDIIEYEATTDYDITTLNQLNTFSTNISTPGQIDISNDGSLIFLNNGGSTTVTRYEMSTPFDLSTLSKVRDVDLSSAFDSNAGDACFFQNDGTTFYMTEDSDNQVLRFKVSTSYDLTTASLQEVIDLSSSTEPEGVYVTGDKNVIVTADPSDDQWQQYE